MATIAAGSSQENVLWSPSVSKSGTKITYIQGSALEVGRFGGEGDLVTAAANGADRRVVRSTEDSDPVWSPTSNNIAVVDDGTILMLNSSGKAFREVQGTSDVNTFTWSPNGECIAASAGDSPNRIVIADVRTGTSKWLTPADIAGYYPAWSPDGKSIVYANASGALMVTNLSSGTTREVASCPAVSCAQQLWPAWSPDGSLIAFVRANESSEQIFIVPSAGGTPQQATFGPDEHISPTWGSPSGLNVER